MSSLGYHELNVTGYCNNVFDVYNSTIQPEWNINNKTVTIKNDLLELIKTPDNTNDNIEDIQGTEIIKNIIKEYNDFQLDYLQSKKKLDDETEKTETEIKILESNFKYIMSIQDKYNKEGDVENNNLKELISKVDNLSELIENNNNLKKIKQEYNEKHIKMMKFFKFIKTINNFNLGSTCSVCMQKNVESYFNPCGHTACNECIEKLNININGCVFCKSTIICSSPLYFI
tara:strand:- start:2964 stop:3653 length:690 start_codon:yes stop_codon:yes gene_type:complete